MLLDADIHRDLQNVAHQSSAVVKVFAFCTQCSLYSVLLLSPALGKAGFLEDFVKTGNEQFF